MSEITLPSVLHFLQRSWGSFEAERSQWAHDRTQLQARVAFLEGQRQGEANLKRDLMRRIKMLEFALQRERAKNSGVAEPPAPAKGATVSAVADAQYATDGPRVVREGREILITYLKEMGYTDEIIHAQAQRVKGMLDSWPPAETVASFVPPFSAAASSRPNNGRQPHQHLPPRKHGKHGLGAQQAPVSGSGGGPTVAKGQVLPPTVQPANDDDGEEDGDFFGNEDESDSSSSSSDDDDANTQRTRESRDAAAHDSTLDGATGIEEDSSLALAELDFLEGLDDDDDDDDNDDVAHDHDSSRRVDGESLPPNGAHGVTATAPLKQARAPESAVPAAVEGIDDFYMTASEAEITQALRAQLGSGKSKSFKMFGSPAKLPGQKKGRHSMTEMFDRPPQSGHESDLSKELGELAMLDVNNDNRIVATAPLDAQPVRKSWRLKASLRSHLDSVRAIAFHGGNDAQLLSAADDGTVKVWDLMLNAKKPLVDVEPAATFRGHTGPVYALTVGASTGVAYSAGADQTIRSWRVPAVGASPYESRRAPYEVAAVHAHTDAVWALDLSPDETRLLSASADGSLRVWAVGEGGVSAVGVHVWGGGPIARAEFVRTNRRHVIVAGTTGSVSVVDAETGQLVVSLDADLAPLSRVFSLRSHATLDLAVTGHADRTVRLLDLATGTCTHRMTAHEGVVSGVDFDPSGLTLVTGGHDRSVRLWDLASHACIDEITTHRSKFDDAIHDVKFHPTLQHFASAGADSVVKVYK